MNKALTNLFQVLKIDNSKKNFINYKKFHKSLKWHNSNKNILNKLMSYSASQIFFMVHQIWINFLFYFFQNKFTMLVKFSKPFPLLHNHLISFSFFLVLFFLFFSKPIWHWDAKKPPQKVHLPIQKKKTHTTQTFHISII